MTGDDVRRLEEAEAEELAGLLVRLQEEMDAQFAEQGLSNEPVEYKTLVRGDYLSYLEQVYGVDLEALNSDE
jgi:hypothetical protein